MATRTEMSIKQKLVALKEPFPPDQVSFRAGPTTADRKRAIALAYIDARDVENRLDDVIGPGAWQCEYIPMPNRTTCCRIGIKVNGEWIWKSNGGSNINDSDKPDSQEMAIKGEYSDAFKRAATKWGIGRYLYDCENIWVDLDGKQIARKEMPKLRVMLVRLSSASKLRSMLTERSETEIEAAPVTAPVKVLKKDIKKSFAALVKEIDAHRRVDELRAWGTENAERISQLSDDFQDALRERYYRKLVELRSERFGGNIAEALTTRPDAVDETPPEDDYNDSVPFEDPLSVYERHRQ